VPPAAKVDDRRMPTSTPATDVDPAHTAALLLLARTGCSTSMRELIATCEPFVRRRAAREAWRRDHVDDVVQDVWVQFLSHADGIRDPATLLAWLGTVTRRAAARVGHRERRLVPTDAPDIGVGAPSAEADALDACHRDQVTDGVREALDRLDESDRRLLLLLHHDDRPGYRDIGREVGRPVGSLGPTRQRLLRRLGRDEDIARLETFVHAA
jgi:RNA polymerase sigma factor (sigma-70 family)